ncbi:glycosyltransferase family 2 protein [Geodermatophilus sp. SYSU D00710]
MNSTVFRILTRRPGRGGRLRRPDGRPFESLVIADVDMEAGVATAQPTWTRPHRDPEGVHALVWYHGEPIGEVTRAGSPDDVLRTLPYLARQELDDAFVEHQVRDALTTPDGWEVAVAAGLEAVPHPARATSAASDVTVAVCSRDRPNDLRRCLVAISRLSTEVAEILVVDNASQDGRTRDVVADFPLVRYVREPRQGLDWARNRALLEARTRVVAFTDDDALVHPRWIDGLLQAFADEPSAVVVTGLVVPAELATPAQVLFEIEGGFGRGFRRMYFAAAVEDGEVAADRYTGIGRAGTGANMAVLREAALALGGFDPALDVGTLSGGCGDLELYFRVVAAGHLVVYEPSAVVRHCHRPTMDGLVRQRRGDGTGSSSWFLGAGRHYGRDQFLSILRFVIVWSVKHHIKGNIGRLVWPRVLPPGTRLAEARGALDAIFGRYYERAQRQAAERAAAHPHEPTAPPLVRTRARRRRLRAGSPVVPVDLSVGGKAADDPFMACAARETVVEVRRDGALMDRFRVHTGGIAMTPARLRRELAARLGSAAIS